MLDIIHTPPKTMQISTLTPFWWKWLSLFIFWSPPPPCDGFSYSLISSSDYIVQISWADWSRQKNVKHKKWFSALRFLHLITQWLMTLNIELLSQLKYCSNHDGLKCTDTGISLILEKIRFKFDSLLYYCGSKVKVLVCLFVLYVCMYACL